MITLNRYEIRKQGLKILNEISDHEDDYYFIHYAVDFHNSNRIAAIAIRHLSSEGEIINFSIDTMAEELNLPITNKNLDKIESSMLIKYFKFIEKHIHSKFIHWNMSSDEYGFKAIEKRAKKLKIDTKITSISENQCINLSHCFKMIYGENYIKNPKFYNLLKLNNIHPHDLLNGKQEAKEIKNQNFKAVTLSCDRKVNVFYELYFLSFTNRLKVQTNWIEIHGLSIQSIYEFSKSKWWFNLISFFLGSIVGATVPLILKRFF